MNELKIYTDPETGEIEALEGSRGVEKLMRALLSKKMERLRERPAMRVWRDGGPLWFTSDAFATAARLERAVAEPVRVVVLGEKICAAGEEVAV
jgi:hypothetical protein